MKTLLTTLALATFVFSSSVSATNVQLRPADNTLETQVCYTAATEGLSAAYALIKQSKQNVSRFSDLLSCNGKSLARTARLFKQANEEKSSTQTARKVRFVTDENLESQVCLDAVIIGVNAALAKHEMKNKDIICNNQNIESFARRFAGTSVSL